MTGPFKFRTFLVSALVLFITFQLFYYQLDAQSDLYYKTRTDVVMVPVYVYTKDGSSVRDLSVDDFEIWEGRRKCDLKDLEVIDHSVGTDEAVTIMPPAGRRQFLFLFDLNFTNPGGLAAARNAAKNFEKAHTVPNDLIAVATFSGPGGINLVCPFTTDRNRIEKALSDLGLAQAFIYRDQAGFTYEDYLDFKSMGLDQDLAALILSTEKWRYATALSKYLDMFNAIGDALEIMHGRKNIVFFSGGFDEEAVLGVTERVQTGTEVDVLSTGTETSGTGGARIMHDKFIDALKSYAKSNAVFYVVDTNRMQTTATPGAEIMEARNKMGDAGVSMYDKSSSQKGYYSLYRTADETGGVLYRNLNDLDSVLADISSRTSYGYLLTFAPSRPGKPGEFREIKVKVKRPGLRVDCQRGYTFEKPYSELTPQEKQFQLAEYISKDIVSSRIPFEFDARVFPGDARLARIPFFVEINGDVFTSLKEQRREPVAVEVYGYLLGERNAPIDFCFNVIESKAAEASEQIEHKGLKYYGLLNAPPGRWKIKVIVRDRELGMISSNISIIDVPDFAAGKLHLCGPVFIEREQGWVSIMDNTRLEPKDRLKGRPLEYPYRWRERDLIPAINPSVSSPDGEIVFLRICGVGDSEEEFADLRVKFDVVDAAGQARAVKGITLLDRQSSSGALDLIFQVPLAGLGLQPGDYLLRVETEKISSGEKDKSEAPFKIPSR
jgi:VWFA-related protein